MILNYTISNKKRLAICAFDLRKLLDSGIIETSYADQILDYMKPHRFINDINELEDYYICLIEFDIIKHNQLLVLITLYCKLHDSEDCHQMPLILK